MFSLKTIAYLPRISRSLTTGQVVLGPPSFKTSGYSRKSPEEVFVPTKPKKPMTPFLAFVCEQKDELLSQRGSMNAPELATRLAERWKVTDKERYIEEYKCRREQFLKDLETYKSSLSKDQLEYIDFKMTKDKEAKDLRKIRRTKPPRMPRTAVNFYCAERCLDPVIKEALRNKEAKRIFPEIFQTYKALTEEEKEKYITMQEEDKPRFRKEFQEWYDRTTSDPNLAKATRDKAEQWRLRLKVLSYI